MSINLRLLEWSWWFSYGPDNSLVLNDNTVTQILGVNGNGKSSIYLIIEELLYNKNSKGIKKADIPNRYGPGGYWGRLTFSKDEDEYIIEVERKAGTLRARLSKNGEDISSHTATNTFKTLEDLLGNDFKTTSQLINQSPTSSLQFLTATDTTRKKFFIEILQLHDYVELFELFKEAAREHAQKVVAIEAQVNTVEKWLKNNQIESTDPMELKPINIDLFEDEKKATILSNELANIKNTNRLIAKNNQYRELLAAIDIDAINAIECQEIQSYDEYQTELGGINASISRHNTQLKKLQSLGDSCPTCEQSVDSSFKQNLIKDEQEAIATLSDKVSLLTSLIDNIKENNRKFKHKQEQVKTWEELFRSIDPKLPKNPINRQDLEDELSNLTIKISNLRQQLKELQEYNERANKHNSRIEVIIGQAAKLQIELEQLSGELAVQQEVLTDLEVLKKSFSTNGLPAYKIENMVKDLEDLTNDYLADLSDGRFTIEFTVTNDKLNVDVTDHGTVVDIQSLSSGELARVNTSTLLAIRKLMNSISKNEINILFLDEVTNVLDETGRERLVEILLEEDLNSYIVSHGWSHPLLTKLVVVKDDEISRLEENE